MTRSDVEESTKEPTLQLVVEFGAKPIPEDVGLYIATVTQMSEQAVRAAKTLLAEEQYSWAEGRVPRKPLRLQRLHLASPLELVLTSASGLTPVVYAATAMLIIERAVRLLMEWQTHRQELASASREDHQDARPRTGPAKRSPARRTPELYDPVGEANSEDDEDLPAALEESLMLREVDRVPTVTEVMNPEDLEAEAENDRRLDQAVKTLGVDGEDVKAADPIYRQLTVLLRQRILRVETDAQKFLPETPFSLRFPPRNQPRRYPPRPRLTDGPPLVEDQESYDQA